MRMPNALRRCLHALLLVVAVIALGACAAPAPSAPLHQGGVAPAGTPAVPMGVDASCKSDADCTVKDVGNCCGAYPACVNVNSPTDPAGVRERCAKSGTMSVCGFREISACTCNRGQCEAAGGGLVQ